MRRFAADLLLPVASGALLASCFPPLNWNPLAWVALVPLGIALGRRPTFELYLGVYVGAMIFHLAALDFVRTSHGASGLSGPRALGWFALGQAAGCVATAEFALGHWWGRRTGAAAALLLPLFWLGAKFVAEALGQLFTGTPFPWLMLAYTQIGHLRLVQCADLGGAWGVELLIALSNGAVVDLLSRRFWPIVAAAGSLFLAIAYGSLRLEFQPQPGPVIGLVPRGVMPNDLSVGSADLWLWPECAVRADQAPAVLAQATSRSTRDDALMIVGCLRPVGGGFANSATVVGSAGCQGNYDKRFPIPWAEYAPWTLPFDVGTAGTVVPGASSPSFVARGRRFGIAICYDASVPAIYRRRDGADFFVVASCEASDDRRQSAAMMLDIVRFRAVEARRAIVRNVEGGYSGIIDGCGRLIAAPQSLAFARPTILGAVPIDDRLSIYGRFGDWLPGGSVLLMAAGFMRQSKPSPLSNRARRILHPLRSSSATSC